MSWEGLGAIGFGHPWAIVSIDVNHCPYACTGEIEILKVLNGFQSSSPGGEVSFNLSQQISWQFLRLQKH